MNNNIWNDDELVTCNLPPINEINPSQDFNWLQENTDSGPLQDLNPQQETPEPELLPPHVETNHGHQLNQTAEPSPEPSRRGRRTKLSEIQRQQNKKMSDRKHRQKQKDTMANLIKENENLEKQVRERKSENEQQRSEIERLKNFNELLLKEVWEIKAQSALLLTAVQGENEHVQEWLESQPCDATVSVPAAKAEFFRKLEEDEESSIDFKDFTITDLHEEQEYRTVGKYQIPLSLVPTAKKIIEVYGDDCVTSKINRNQAGNIYILFCATVKEMDELPLDKVTEKTMMKWRDAIKDALRIQFKVEFAMEHLKNTIAPRYFGMKANEEDEKIDVAISKVKPYLNDLEECKKFIDIAKEYSDRPLSEGLWG
ncbi:hypothetical protein SLA2020_048410 [Shorea laevis]